MPTITPRLLVDEVLGQAPALARDVFENTQHRLEGRHRVKPRQAELALFLSLAESLRRLREPFIEALHKHLREDLPAALTEAPSAPPKPVDPFSMELPELSLVDEQQALEDVAVAATIRAIEEAAGLLLQPLAQLFEALRGATTAKRSTNPLRPAVFARLLARAMQELTLAPAARLALLRVAGEALAELLVPIYTQLCQHTRDADVLPLLAEARPAGQAAAAPRPGPRPAAPGDETPTVPHTLDNLLRRMQQHDAEQSTHPTPLSADQLPSLDTLLASLGLPDEGPVPPAPRGPTRPAPLPTLDGVPADGDTAPGADAVDLLSRVYDKILDDPGLLPEVRNLLSRLQVSVLRIAADDEQLLTRQEHPTWQFINGIASHSTGFSHAGDARLRAFLVFAESLITRVGASTRPTATLYWEALQELHAYIDTSAREAVAQTQNTIEMLERAQQREKWQGILRQQVREQLAQAVVSTTVRGFLEGPWVTAMAEAMVRFGQQAPQVQPMIELVDDLLWSVQPLRHPEERDTLRQMLPTLTARLQFGFDLIQWPEARRTALMDELMERHSRLLRLAPDPRPAPSKVASLAEEDTTPSVHATDSLANSSFWSDSLVDRGTLPTVPVPFGPQDEAQVRATLQAWVAGLRVGTWCHMFVQSEWLTAQLTWVSDSGNYYVFSGEAGAAPQSLTRGALLQLRAAGLLAELEERTLVQRAVDTMMHDMEA